ncbi:cysteine-rich receptor-like protein kinase 44 [Andrographis paniculata]|uniref:cysteine-rich receptor-like protein kinase 44 n=1 Tax=Andrographis paniculata TaxID=175694 RepID=UPI0021E7356B|nr:cysteine-rich receptor-like protein kinase 44 [Andrographis paniculata]
MSMAFIFLTTLLLNLFPFTTSDNLYSCKDTGTYKNGSRYKTNLDNILSTLPTKIDTNGFYNASAGRAPETVYVLFLCRGDVPASICRQCASYAIAEVFKFCPDQKGAIVYYDQCMLRYSNNVIYGTVETSADYMFPNPFVATAPDQHNRDLTRLLDSIRRQAAYSGLGKKYAAAKINGPDSRTIYAQVQCTPDLSPDVCLNCLNNAAALVPQCCSGQIGGRVLWSSCNIRYEDTPFLYEDGNEQNPQPSSGVAANEPPGKSLKCDCGRAQAIVVAASVSASVILAAVIGALVVRMGKEESRRRRETGKRDAVESVQYTFGAIRAATDNFSDEKKLGQGGFGAVYEGLLPNGEKIAIKRLSKDSAQGLSEFKNEVVLLARLQHKNLVKLRGFSMEETEKLLVYEYVTNGSLDKFIAGSKDSAKHLDWHTRYKIIEGIGRGLLYLHENSRLKIIHRDIKPANILLDKNMNPKISDFGMARLFERDETEAKTGKIAGTYGYMPPEYARHGRFSVKSDVYSFGVLMLEIINGQKSSNHIRCEDEVGITSFAWKNWRDGKNVDTVDPLLRSNPGSMGAILRCIHIGLLCCQNDANKRPTTASVALMLSNLSMILPVPSEPAYYFGPAKSSSSDQLTLHISENGASISELHPR